MHNHTSIATETTHVRSAEISTETRRLPPQDGTERVLVLRNMLIGVLYECYIDRAEDPEAFSPEAMERDRELTRKYAYDGIAVSSDERRIRKNMTWKSLNGAMSGPVLALTMGIPDERTIEHILRQVGSNDDDVVPKCGYYAVEALERRAIPQSVDPGVFVADERYPLDEECIAV